MNALKNKVEFISEYLCFDSKQSLTNTTIYMIHMLPSINRLNQACLVRPSEWKQPARQCLQNLSEMRPAKKTKQQPASSTGFEAYTGRTGFQVKSKIKVSCTVHGGFWTFDVGEINVTCNCCFAKVSRITE